MATPFGVYLTTGAIRAGAKDLPLVATGMLLFAVYYLAVWAGETAGLYVLSRWSNPGLALWLRDAGPFAAFLAAMRLMPISGIHAAEHKVVHAIERGEPLELEAVRRMPRVHPRCGTNIAIGASLFLALAAWKAIEFEPLRLLVAALLTLILWRPLGNLVQWLVTTRPPTDRHIRTGIAAGRELLEKYWRTGPSRVSFAHRIAMTGILHVMAGSIACYGVIRGLFALFGVPPPA
jgi:hypothetical protein